MLIAKEKGHVCAIIDSIDNMTDQELQTIFEIWDDMGRSWEYAIPARLIKTYKWPEFEAEGKEVSNDK